MRKNTNPNNILPLLPFKPEPWQMPALMDRSLLVLLTGSAGGGKSRLCAEKINAVCKKYPGVTALALRKTRESMTNSTVLFLERSIIGSDRTVKHNKYAHRFEYSNGSLLLYGGMKDEDQREMIRSIGAQGGLDFVWMEEANQFSEDDFNEVLARLRARAMPWQQCLLSTNPDYPAHWINRRLLMGGEAAVYYSAAADNPHNAPAYLDTLKRLTGVLGQRLRDGLWIQAEGAVYSGYDRQMHLLDWFAIPLEWMRFRSIDFGYTNPFVCQWWAQDPDGRLYLYREIYRSQGIVEDHAKQIEELSRGENIAFTVADHDAEDRATLERHGVTTVAAYKDIRVGIQAVESRLRRAGDGRPRLFILRGATVEIDRAIEAKRRPTSTDMEFDTYIWPKLGRTVREVPLDENNHGMDAMRYGVVALDLNGIWQQQLSEDWLVSKPRAREWQLESMANWQP